MFHRIQKHIVLLCDVTRYQNVIRELAEDQILFDCMIKKIPCVYYLGEDDIDAVNL